MVGLCVNCFGLLIVLLIVCLFALREFVLLMLWYLADCVVLLALLLVLFLLWVVCFDLAVLWLLL